MELVVAAATAAAAAAAAAAGSTAALHASIQRQRNGSRDSHIK